MDTGRLRGIAGQARHASLLGLGVLVLCLGIPMSSMGGRSLGGFDFKLAEFAPIAIGAGFAELLAGFSIEKGKALWFKGTRLAWIGTFFMTFRVGAWVLMLFLLCLSTYGVRGDLGPLMVIVPALLCTMFVWVSPWRVAASVEGVPRAPSRWRQRVKNVLLGNWHTGWRMRLMAWLGAFGAVAFAFTFSKAAVGWLSRWIMALPIGGETIMRAVERFDTIK